MDPLERMKKVHVWIGTNNQPDDEYEAYFEIDYSTDGDFDDPDYKICGFCKDIGQNWYDEDFIGIIPRLEDEVPVKELMELAALDEDEYGKVMDVCKQMGIEKANAIFYLTDAEIELSKPYKDNYNELRYIGLFNSGM